MKKIKILVTTIIVCLFSLWFWTLMLLTVRPKKAASSTPEKFGLNYENIDFITHDGLVLKGWIISPKRNSEKSKQSPENLKPGRGKNKKIVIICHGNGRERSEYLDRALFLAENGYFSLLFDMRGHGTSQGKILTLGAQETRDLKTIIDDLNRKKGFTSFIPWGWSLGGTVSILSLETSPMVKGAVSDCPFDTYYNVVYHTSKLWLGNIPKFITDITIKAASILGNFNPSEVDCLKVLRQNNDRPVLLVLGTKDRRVPDRMAARLGTALLKKEYKPYNELKIPIEKSKNPRLTSSIFCGEECGHLKVWKKFNQEYKKRILEFLIQAFNE